MAVPEKIPSLLAPSAMQLCEVGVLGDRSGTRSLSEAGNSIHASQDCGGMILTAGLGALVILAAWQGFLRNKSPELGEFIR